MEAPHRHTNKLVEDSISPFIDNRVVSWVQKKLRRPVEEKSQVIGKYVYQLVF